MTKKIAMALAAFTQLCVSSYAALSVPDNLFAPFHQTVRSHESNRTLEYEGKVWVKVPEEARWVYEKPVRKIICVTHDRAWVIEPELEQATLFQLKKAIPLITILKQAKKVSDRAYIAEYEGLTYHIEVDEKGNLKSISHKDDLDNRVTLSFGNIDTKPIDEKTLRCDVPEDYDIIDGRY